MPHSPAIAARRRPAASTSASAISKLITLGRVAAPAEVVGRAPGDDPAGGDHRDPVGELLGLVHVVGGQQDGLAEVAEALDHLPGGAAGGGVEAGGRLVEEEQLGVADERDRDVEPPLLAAGQAPGALIGLLGESDELDRLVDRSRGPVVAGVHLERLAHGQQRLHPAFLEDEADPPAPIASRRRRIGAEDLDLAAVAVEVALQDLEIAVVFPAPLGPRNAKISPRLDLEVDPAQRLEVAVGLAQPPDADHGFRHGRAL